MFNRYYSCHINFKVPIGTRDQKQKLRFLLSRNFVIRNDRIYTIFRHGNTKTYTQFKYNKLFKLL